MSLHGRVALCMLVLVVSSNGQGTLSASVTPCLTMDAALHLPRTDTTLFLAGDEFIEYNFQHGAEGKVGDTVELGITISGVQAAFTARRSRPLRRDGPVHLLKGCMFYKYNATRQGTLRFVTSGNLSTLGLPCDMDAVVTPGRRNTLAFKGCQIWRLRSRQGVFRLLRDSVQTIGLPCDLDAAVEWESGETLFFKGAQFWKLDLSVTGPYSTDRLNLCSWSLCGEADWMGEQRAAGEELRCNGDARLCPLRVNQVTLPGLHNAGAGFAGGFGLFDCWTRNHGLSIFDQLEQGIRHLDVDPCFETCGILGACHSFFCGGSICVMIKQIRHFLRSRPDEILILNFNHEIEDPEKVFPDLTRQLTVQLGPMLNQDFRASGNQRWPTLGASIRSNRRVFVLYAAIVQQWPHNSFYRAHDWIHTEDWYGSTWRPFSVSSGCEQVVAITSERCEARRYRELVEVSIVPQTGGCVRENAETCRPFLHAALRACENIRFQHGSSPNVLLVDYPEDEAEAVGSVYDAVFHQNLRNILRHRASSCRARVDAAVRVGNRMLVFSGSKVIEYSDVERAQVNMSVSHELTNVDAAYMDPVTDQILVVKNCHIWTVNVDSLLPQSQEPWDAVSPCEGIDAAVTWNAELYVFKDCYVTRQGFEPMPLRNWGLPCYLEAAVESKDGHMLLFRAGDYWQYDGVTTTYGGEIADWNIDVVECDEA